MDAKPGTHAPAASTWDLRASSVVVGYRHGFLKDGFLHFTSYNANFSSTTGKQSAQFGLHYVLLKPFEEAKVGHGLSGTATSVFSFPLTERYSDGTPPVALGFYVGMAPTAIISGNLNFLTVPLTLGVGVPLAPHPTFKITPWFEIAPSFDVENVIRTTTVQDIDQEQIDQLIADAQNGVPLTVAQVTSIVDTGVELDTGFHAGTRAGLELALNMSEGTSLLAYGMVGSLDSLFNGTLVTNVGAGLVWRWDDIVPAVLPAERRLQRESCLDIEERFRACPRSKQYRPEAGSRSASATSSKKPGEPRALPASRGDGQPPRTTPNPAPPGSVPPGVAPPGSSPPGAAPPGSTPANPAAPKPAAPPLPRPNPYSLAPVPGAPARPPNPRLQPGVFPPAPSAPAGPSQPADR